MIRKALPAAVLLFALPCWATPTTSTKKKAHAVPASTSHRASHTTSHASSRVGASSRSHKATKQTVAEHHQPAAMDPDRATKIQQAMIRAGYMTGEPTGVWDSQSVAAMQKMQGDNGWQTKITPDSRALIKLGLGPQNDAANTASTSEVMTGGGE